MLRLTMPTRKQHAACCEVRSTCSSDPFSPKHVHATMVYSPFCLGNWSKSLITCQRITIRYIRLSLCFPDNQGHVDARIYNQLVVAKVVEGWTP